MSVDTEHESFWRPDNSAVFTAAISSRTGPFIFRLACELTETVNADALATALAKAAKRFPYLFVTLRKGVFWHYFEPARCAPVPEQEGFVPCARRVDDRERPLCRVYAYGRTISCEFHHAITDGTGGMIFLRALVIEYLAAVEADVEAEVETNPRAAPDSAIPGARMVDFIDLDAEPDPSEWEDSYRKYFRRDMPPPDPVPKAWLIPGERMRGTYRVTVAEIPLAPALERARGKKASLTEYLTAVYIAALQNVYRAERNGRGPRHGKPITIQVPVNLRKMYPSRTMRNFFLFTAPFIDPRLGVWELDEIVERVHHQMRLGVTKMEFYRQLRRNVGGELNPLGRGVLLPIKNLTLRIINRKLNVALYSGSLSNLNAISMPDYAAAHVRRFHFFPPSSLSTGATIGVLSWRDKLYVTVGSTAAETAVERSFYGLLAREGFEVRVETNMPYRQGR